MLLDSEPRRQRSNRERKDSAIAEVIRRGGVENREQQEVALPLAAQQMPLALDEAGVGGNEEGAQENDVVVDGVGAGFSRHTAG